MKPRLAKKLAALRADITAPHFILADAKDAGLAWGAASAGPLDGSPAPSPHVERAGERGEAGTRFRSITDFRSQIRDIVHQGAIDILLASASTHSVLAHN